MGKRENLLRKRAAKAAVYGALIALAAIVISTLAASYVTLGNIEFESLIQTQRTNVALWVINLMPLIFILWGQHVSTVLVEQADTMIIDQTHELWDETRQLREQIREEIEQEQRYDSLTQLPNTGEFLHAVEVEIAKTDPKQTESDTFIQTLSDYISRDHNPTRNAAIILFDIDNFKEINSTLGSHNGDLLLREIGSRLKRLFKDSGVFIARVGGDDFALLNAGASDSDAIKVTEPLRRLFDQSFNLNGVAVMLEISIGISVWPQHGESAQQLLQHAEIAMYACKKEAREYTVYTPALNVHDLEDLVLKTEIRAAFDNHELSLHYQPKVNGNNQVNEVEALVRWHHPERGMIPPDKFIPMIVKKRLNGELLQRILTLALTQAKVWERDGICMRIALNLTAFDLLEPELPAMIERMLRDYGLKTDVLKLEITETTLVENQALTLQTLTRFADMGIPTSIDDFGTGYSSLAYLSSLPIAEIKIDRSFVMGMADNHRNDKIIQAIIALAHSLSLHTVAEGVEDARTMGQLKGLKCDFIQGYHISRPLDGAAFTAWLKAWNSKNLTSLNQHPHETVARLG